ISDEVVFFFFSSRRRHTSFSRDWSSDVCSSDLRWQRSRPGQQPKSRRNRLLWKKRKKAKPRLSHGGWHRSAVLIWHRCRAAAHKIGRASCRERVESSEVGVASTSRVGE